MTDKKNILYIITIIVLVIILGTLWYLIVNSNINLNGYKLYVDGVELKK